MAAMPKISEARRAQRRAQILDAARACFLRQGLHGTTMDDIIAASGLSAGAVYGYFPGKEQIIAAAVTGALAEISALLDPLLAQDPPLPPPALVEAIAAAVTRFSAREGFDLRRLALLGWSEMQHNPRLAGPMQAAYGAFRSALAECARTWTRHGMIGAAARPDDVAKAVLALVMGFVAQAAILGDVDPAALGRGVAQLTPQAGPASARRRGSARAP